MLKAFWRWLWPQEAEPTRPRRSADYVTRDELADAIAEATKELQYEWNEWYEKFNTLHLRLSKREKRQRVAQNGAPEQLEIQERPSVLHHRRLGSV